MANIEQKRADLEKALQAIDKGEMEAVAGGLSNNAKLALQIGGAVAMISLNVAAVGAGAYFGNKSGAKSDSHRKYRVVYDDKGTPHLVDYDDKGKLYLVNYNDSKSHSDL